MLSARERKKKTCFTEYIHHWISQFLGSTRSVLHALTYSGTRACRHACLHVLTLARTHARMTRTYLRIYTLFWVTIEQVGVKFSARWCEELLLDKKIHRKEVASNEYVRHLSCSRFVKGDKKSVVKFLLFLMRWDLAPFLLNLVVSCGMFTESSSSAAGCWARAAPSCKHPPLRNPSIHFHYGQSEVDTLKNLRN